MGTKAALAVLMVVASAVAACGGGESEADIAARVATEWVAGSIEDTSDAIVELVAAEYPAASRLASGLLAGQIRENVTWTYSVPQRRLEGRYDVTATATVRATLSLPLLGTKTYAVSLPFDLAIDTTTGRVVSWAPNLPSGTVREEI